MIYLDLMLEDGFPVSDEQDTKIFRLLELIREWNPVVSIVSQGDAEMLVERHLVDSLSLVKLTSDLTVRTGVLLDIGTGGGFPAIPIKVMLPDLQVILVERSIKRIGFLRKVVAALRLEGITIVEGVFPAAVVRVTPDVITARAVEEPDRILKGVVPFVEAGAVFLCQSGDPRGKLPARFHVEPVEDAWSRTGLRRGSLYLVRRKQ